MMVAGEGGQENELKQTERTRRLWGGTGQLENPVCESLKNCSYEKGPE